ncbi:MAG: hypothetical protein M0Q01_04555 [Syntrophales bacterium]|jgi:diphthamide synthase subunit DPH2|nr:hypothetical protein [Syntrophales bacterium]
MRGSSDKKQPKLDREGTGDKARRADPPPCRHRVHLKGPEDVRRLLSAIANDLRQQKIDPLVAGKVIYCAQTLLDVFKQHDFIVKIGELEAMIKDSGYYGRRG